MPSIIREVAETFSTLAQGYSVTFRNMFRKTVTENYPHEPVHFQPRYRGIHVLHRDENGLEKCVGCFLCAAACPANCIYIEAAENTETNRISAAERYATVYNIDYSRCIFCGYCVEACPTDAITHGHGFELATYDINSMIYRKEQLLEAQPSKASPDPQHRAADSRHRATVPSPEIVNLRRGPRSSEPCRRRLVAQNHAEKGVVDLEAAVVFDEPKL